MKILEVLIILVTLWTIPWKIYTVWIAVKLDQKRWFVALLLLNTLSILELIYIFWVLKKSVAEVKQDFREGWELLKNGLKNKEEPAAEVPKNEVES